MIGAGSIGGLLAAELAACEAEVLLCARLPLERLTVERSRLPRSIDLRSAEAPIELVTSPREARNVEVVIVALKAHDTAAAEPWLERLVGPQTTVVVVQNGVEHGRLLRRFLPPDGIVPAIIDTAVERRAEGDLIHRAGDLLTLADRPGAERLGPLLGGSVLRVEVSADFTTAAWRKLLGNLASNPLTTLTGRRMEVFGDPAVRAAALGLLDEALPVARAEGARLDDEAPSRIVAGLAALPAEGGSSMLYDRLSGRPLEVDGLCGGLLRAAARHGIEVPLNAQVATLLAALPVSKGITA